MFENNSTTSSGYEAYRELKHRLWFEEMMRKYWDPAPEEIKRDAACIYWMRSLKKALKIEIV